MLAPLVGSPPFDDILLVSKDGTIVYQSNRTGPQFTTLTDLLRAQPEVATAASPSSAEETKSEETKSDDDGAGIEEPAKPQDNHYRPRRPGAARPPGTAPSIGMQIKRGGISPST